MFRNCSKLTSIVFSGSVTVIGGNAFQNSGLTGVTIPNSVTSIGGSSFRDCSNLKIVTIEDGSVAFALNDSNTDHFTNSPIETLYLGRNMQHTSSVQFQNKTSLKTVTIGNEVTLINSNSFQNCTELKTLILGNALLTIGDNAFSGCNSLEGALNFPNKLTIIRPGAFQGCSSISSVTIPNSVLTIWNGSFSDCSNLKTVTIEDGTVELDFSSFNCFLNTPIETLYLGRNINRVQFSNNSALETVTIGNDVTTINANSFANCTGLQYLTLGNARWICSGCNSYCFARNH